MRTLIVVGAASLFVAALLLFSQRVATQVGTRRTYSPGRTPPASPAPQLSLNLNGRWKDDGNNTLIDITMAGSSITAKYLIPHPCSHPDSNGNKVTLDIDFNGTLDTTSQSIKGSIIICFFDTDTGVTFSHGPTALRLTKVSATSMSGEYETPDRGVQQVSYTRLKGFINGTGKEIPRPHPFEADPDGIVPSDDCSGDLWVLTSVNFKYESDVGSGGSVSISPSGIYVGHAGCTGHYTANWYCSANKATRMTTDEKKFTLQGTSCAPAN